jgi:hypothetical protein
LVIRLWSHESASGADEASKDRPCAIVVAARQAGDAAIQAIVAPITHRPPDDPLDSIEIPPAVCRCLGLDRGRHWLRMDELDRFTWPGFDLRPIPGRPGEYAYGMLPAWLFEDLRRGILDRQIAKRGRTQSRDV